MSALDRWLLRLCAGVILVGGALHLTELLAARGARAQREARAAALAAAAALHRADQPDLVASLLTAAVEASPEDPALRQALVEARIAHVLADPGAPAAALSLTLEAGLMGVALAQGAEARRQVALAKLALARGERALARRRLDAAEAADANLGAVHLYRGVLAFGDGDHGPAAVALERALALDPEDHLARLTLGQVHAARRDLVAAHRALEKAAVALDNATAWLALGRVALARERWSEAEQALRAGLKRSPADPELHGLLGRALEADGRGPAAVEHLTLAYQKGGDLDAYALLGRIYHDQKRHRDAVGVLGDVARLRPNDPEPIYVLALAAEAMGDLSTARGALRDAVERSGEAPRYAELKTAAQQRLALIETVLGDADGR